MKRRTVQILATLMTNLYLKGFAKASIYKGPLKYVCSPGLQCYSCPSSVTACPLGALQNALATLRQTLVAGQLHVGLYVVGFIGTLGMVFGRLICGWVCPFGLFQDLLYKIPTPKLKLPRFASCGRYLMLVILVFLAPVFLSFFDVRVADASEGHQSFVTVSINEEGSTYPWYCKVICPAGTFEAGLPKVLLDPDVRESMGFWFRLKWTVMIIFLLWMVLTSRVFCRVACPLGAIYGLFNKISLWRLSVENEKCTECGQCQAVCPMDLKVYENPNQPGCIRCLNCISACDFNLIRSGFCKNGKERTI